ncbi:MAG: phosphotransferase, partial [Pseudomonadota bacterium]|nr:phosphotransferase [Pseudomonadota bacterium]
EEAAATFALLKKRAPKLPAAGRADTDAALAAQARLESRLARIGDAPAGALKTRSHGDLHLGQVLVAGNDFVIIDFEGEPARSFDERRAKSSPLRDVAGMLRSFDYARWSALRRSANSAEEMQRFAPELHDWHAATREAFLAGYSRTLAPPAPAAALDTGLLALFEIEKALYELRYELNNRVDWAPVPLQGLLALADAGTAD